MDRRPRKRWKSYLEPESNAKAPASTRWRIRRRAQLASEALARATAETMSLAAESDGSSSTNVSSEWEIDTPRQRPPPPSSREANESENEADVESDVAESGDECDDGDRNTENGNANGNANRYINRRRLSLSLDFETQRARAVGLGMGNEYHTSSSESEDVDLYADGDADDACPHSKTTSEPSSSNDGVDGHINPSTNDDASFHSQNLSDDVHSNDGEEVDPLEDDGTGHQSQTITTEHSASDNSEGVGFYADDGTSLHSQRTSSDGRDASANSDDSDIGDQPNNGDNQDELHLFDESLNLPLFHGSAVTKAEALLMILSFVMKNCLSASAVRNLLEMLNALIGTRVFASTKSVLRQLFRNDAIQLSFHFYCLMCSSFVRSFTGVSDENIFCQNCNQRCIVSDLSQGNFFVTANLTSQIKTLLERKDISPHLFYRDNRSKQQEGNIEDIFDGVMYKKLMEEDGPLSNRHNLSYTFNCDGLPVFKSSKYSIWPIFIMINELPPKLRFNNLILAGVWFGKVDPKMEVFLKQFTIEANKLADEGVFWKHEDNFIQSKLFGLCCCADAPARAAMQNRIKFNGYSGCGLCYHPGKTVDRVVKYPFDVCDYSDRTDEEMLEDMVQAGIQGRTVKGVKGPSALINLSHFPICWGFPADFMHCLLLGVARQLAELWFASPALNQWYIGSPRIISLIDSRLKSIRPPSIIMRSPRCISERKFWKASEWYAWLLFYSVPCLKGILPQEYWQHLVVLVEASFLLLQKSISVDDVNKCDILLFSFTCRCQLLYGPDSMTFNVHSLTHLAKGVYYWGPLWTHSCFPFEAANWRIKRQLHGTRGVLMQVIRKYLTIHTLPFFIDNHIISYRVKSFAADMLNIKIRTIEEQDTQALGCGRFRFCTREERRVLEAVGFTIEENEPVMSFARLRKGGSLFSTATYRAQTMTRNNKFLLISNDRVCELLDIFHLNDQYILLVKLLILDDPSFKDDTSDTKLSYVRICTGFSELPMAISANEAIGNCISMNFDGVHYISVFPNYISIN